MKVNKLEHKHSNENFSRHVNYLKEKGYSIINCDLNILAHQDFESYGVKSNIEFQIEQAHSQNKKVALFFDNYESNRNRLRLISEIVNDGVNHLDLNPDDIVCAKSINGFAI